jgi:type 1 glutamine amidotransferase
MFVQPTIVVALLLALAAPAAAADRTVLLVTESRGYVHASIPDARAAIARWDAARGDVRVVELRGADVTAERLRGAAAVVFANSNGELPVARRALRRFVARGGGLAGFHSASGMFDDWPGWETLLGGRFDHHGPAGAVETARLVRPGHPAVRGVPRTFPMAEEWYVHEPGVGRRATVLARWGTGHPLVWVRTPGRGRVFYDALGHFAATWTDPRHEALMRSGLRWVLAG